MSITIRRATLHDHEDLANLFEEFYEVFNMEQTLSGLSKELLRVDDTREFSLHSTKDFLNDKHSTFVAELDGKLIGYISGTITHRDHYIHAVQAEVIDWYVTEQFRGQAVGKQLYEAFLEDVKKKGAEVLTVEAFSQNTKSIKTYERMGFVPDSVILKKLI